MIDGNRNGHEYEEENRHEERDGGGDGSVKVDKNGEEAGGERDPGKLTSYSRGGTEDVNE